MLTKTDMQVSTARRSRHVEQGFIMGTLLVLIIVLSFLMVAITQSAIGNWQSATKESARTNATFAADAGVDYGINQLNQDNTWSGTAGEVDVLNNATIRTTYEVTAVDGSLPNRKIVQSTGRSYRPATSTTPFATRIFEAELHGLVSENTSLVAGVGGLVMRNSSKIVDGAVFSNGTIFMEGTAQIGTNTNPLQVFVANRVCPIPADATFPEYCAVGENNDPIEIDSPNSFIYGEVSANHQFDDSNMINVDFPALSSIVADSGVVAQDLPVHDRAAMIAAMPSGSGTSAASASCTSNNGTKIWGPNEKITGDVVVSKKCTVEIRGDVWIDGTLEMRNQGAVEVADSLGANRPVIMIDGEDGFSMSQSAALTQNAAGSNVNIITYWSDAACSPDCADVTGADLENSQDVTTIDIVNAGSAAEAVFYAKWSKTIVRNSVDLGAIIAQTIELQQSAALAFGSSLPGFTPKTTWIKKGYLRVYQ